ncbi:aminotransferase class IV [Hymenobacter taeanensis]|uniref:branched-chain-amino-acid transaminase n=1 Tax=Hymenobacter taeanensis TaxID=2735321 RepID=A0A6M6BJG6_9BACT|nr:MULTISPECIES: aminotransferase class IV [Hymenobacter]QJX48701.1 aminotransferase class IV [Hymenobacter taeanensis]UOQ81799.1 aminotransferase class IV [Hymenobacter sp. 5414T-23]
MISGSAYLLSNGQLLPAADFMLPLPNRGLYFNDGFFETMVWDESGLRYLPQHLARLQRAAAVLSLELPPEVATATALSQTLGQLAAVNELPVARLRLQLWREGGGLYSPTTAGCAWVATSQPFSPLETPITRADFAQAVHTNFSVYSFCKGPNALTYVLAAQEREQRQLKEILLTSAEGYVAEAVSSAVAWIWEGAIYAPALGTGCVAGVRLAHLHQVSQTLGLPWHEGLYFPQQLLAAEAVFTANIAGIRPVEEVAGVRFTSEQHPVLQQLRAAEALG